MNFNKLYNFLQDLNNNNSKEWMDANRKRYKEVRDSYIAWLDTIDAKLATIDDEYFATPGKKGINRINNNLLYHPNKPVYKDHFGAGLDKKPNTADFYVEIGLSESTCLAGGLWRPDAATLRSVRDAIDYNGEELKEIINKKSFKQTFGTLYEGEKLIRPPKGYSKDHPHLDLLQNKTFAVLYPLKKEEVLSKDFAAILVSVYKEMLPFRRYLNNAITV